MFTAAIPISICLCLCPLQKICVLRMVWTVQEEIGIPRTAGAATDGDWRREQGRAIDTYPCDCVTACLTATRGRPTPRYTRDKKMAWGSPKGGCDGTLCVETAGGGQATRAHRAHVPEKMTTGDTQRRLGRYNIFGFSLERGANEDILFLLFLGWRGRGGGGG